MRQHVLSGWLLRAFARQGQIAIYDKGADAFGTSAPDAFMIELDAHSREIEDAFGLVGVAAALGQGCQGDGKLNAVRDLLAGRFECFLRLVKLLLRNQALSEKRNVWEDMLQVLEKLGRPISERQRGYFLRA